METVSEEIASEVLRLDPKALAESEEDFQHMVEEIASMAKRIGEQQCLDLSVRLSSGDRLQLSDREGIIAWHRAVEDRTQAEILRMLRRQVGLNVPKHIDFRRINPEIFANTQAFREYVRLQAWNRAKGALWEWAVLLALASANPGRESSPMDHLCLGPADSPLVISLNRQRRLLWYQRRMAGLQSGLGVRPDFFITQEHGGFHSDSIVGFIECKCTSTISSKLIRELFGVAYDVGASFAILASYERVSSVQRRGARMLGVTALINPLRDLRRGDYLARKLNLIDSVKEEIDRIDNEKPFYHGERVRRPWVDGKPR